jgi:hypothetical protein
MATAILGKIQISDNFYPDEIGIEKIMDAAIHQERKICYLYGGEPAWTTGAIGVFDSTGRILDAHAVKSLYGFEAKGSIFVQGDSIVLRTLDGYGTGFIEESIIVFTLKNNKLTEVFRCAGDGRSEDGNLYEKDVELFFVPSNGNEYDIVRKVKFEEYDSFDQRDTGHPSMMENSIEVYKFNNKTGKYQIKSEKR